MTEQQPSKPNVIFRYTHNQRGLNPQLSEERWTDFSKGWKETPYVNLNNVSNVVKSLTDQISKLRAFIDNPPKHDYWRVGDPETPRELKSGNGELHTLKCKKCGKKNPADNVCRFEVDTSNLLVDELLLGGLDGD